MAWFQRGIAVIVLFLAGQSRAQPAAGDNSPGFAPVVPSLQLTGDTSGKATFRASLDVALQLSPRYVLSLLPSGQVQTSKGLANLLTADDEGATSSLPFRIGGGIVLNDLGTFVSSKSTLASPEIERAWKVAAIDRCRQVCAVTPAAKNCAHFDPPPTDPSGLTPESMCAEGGALYARLEAASPEARQVRRETKLFPVPKISLAGLWGQDRFEFLQKRDDGQLTEAKQTFGTWGLAAGYTGIVGGHTSIEGTATLSGSRKESDVTVEWCIPNAPVAGEEPDGPFPTTACKKAAVGQPAFQQESRLSLHIGFIDPSDVRWRVAVGPTLTLGKSHTKLGLEAPFYLQVAEVLGEGKDKVDYRGMLRITPRFEYNVRDGMDDERRFFLALELLGQRSLFSNALDSISNL